MFKFLKEKLKGAISQTAEEIEEKGETQTTDTHAERDTSLESDSSPSAQELINETS